MSIFIQTRNRVSKFLQAFFRKKRTWIGIYGPPNAGKTTLANRIARDWTGEEMGQVSEIPHETRRASRKSDITISGSNGSSITIDIVDTPGVTTKIDYMEFLEYGVTRDEASTGQGGYGRCGGSHALAEGRYRRGDIHAR